MITEIIIPKVLVREPDHALVKKLARRIAEVTADCRENSLYAKFDEDVESDDPNDQLSLGATGYIIDDFINVSKIHCVYQGQECLIDYNDESIDDLIEKYLEQLIF